MDWIERRSAGVPAGCRQTNKIRESRRDAGATILSDVGVEKQIRSGTQDPDDRLRQVQPSMGNLMLQ